MQISNKKEWKKLLKKAMSGNRNAQYEIGYYYDDGLKKSNGKVIVDANIIKAVKWYTKAAKQGEVSAQDALGTTYSSGDREIGVNLKKAIKWTKKAIEQGSPTSAYNLGTIYRDLGNLEKAFKWYKKSVKMGDIEANFDLFLCYYFGIGIEINRKKAKMHLKNITQKIRPNFVSLRTYEDAFYWSALITLIESGLNHNNIKKIRVMLEIANEDNDHEQANELLNKIGKSNSLIQS